MWGKGKQPPLFCSPDDSMPQMSCLKPLRAMWGTILCFYLLVQIGQPQVLWGMWTPASGTAAAECRCGCSRSRWAVVGCARHNHSGKIDFIVCWVYDWGMRFMDLLLIKSKSSARDVFLLTGWVFLIINIVLERSALSLNSLYLAGTSLCQGHSWLLQIPGSVGKKNKLKWKGGNLAEIYRSFLRKKIVYFYHVEKMSDRPFGGCFWLNYSQSSPEISI